MTSPARIVKEWCCPVHMARARCYLSYALRRGSWKCLWGALEEFLLSFIDEETL